MTTVFAPNNDRVGIVIDIQLKRIRSSPLNPRQAFDEAALDELAASIRQHGLLQPILLRPADDGFLVVAGERRYRAAERAGLDLSRDEVTARLDELLSLERRAVLGVD